MKDVPASPTRTSSCPERIGLSARGSWRGKTRKASRTGGSGKSQGDTTKALTSNTGRRFWGALPRRTTPSSRENSPEVPVGDGNNPEVPVGDENSPEVPVGDDAAQMVNRASAGTPTPAKTSVLTKANKKQCPSRSGNRRSLGDVQLLAPGTNATSTSQQAESMRSAQFSSRTSMRVPKPSWCALH